MNLIIKTINRNITNNIHEYFKRFINKGTLFDELYLFL